MDFLAIPENYIAPDVDQEAIPSYHNKNVS